MVCLDIKHKLFCSGIEFPVTWLSDILRCSKTKAHNIIYRKQKFLSEEDMTRLCLEFNCSPNELYVWDASSNYHIPKDHSINSSIRTKEVTIYRSSNQHAKSNQTKL
ncbi:MAG: hypothetical protein JNM95_06625 [Chitinophagaceae bacterium]|nr:hypothetical protein [Chitinophagaceae bacterium]